MELRIDYFFIVIFTTLCLSCTSTIPQNQNKLEKEIAEFNKQYQSDQICDGKSVLDYNREIYIESDKQNTAINAAFMELLPFFDGADPLVVDKYLDRLESIDNPIILRAGFDQDDASSAYKNAVESNDCKLINKNAEIFKQRIITFGTARAQKIQHDTRMAKGIPVPPESCSFIGNYLNKKFTMCYENYQLPSQDFVTACKVRASISRAAPTSIVYGTKCPATIGVCINSASLGLIEYQYEDISKESSLKNTCEYFGGEWKSTPWSSSDQFQRLGDYTRR